MTTDTGRTAAATRARMRASEIKKARELSERGWHCRLPGIENLPFKPAVFDDPTTQLYATNRMQETCRVVDWTLDGRPILAMRDGRTSIGTLDYVFSVGPK